MSKRFLTICSFLAVSLFTNAQSDTTFWFAVPDVSSVFNYDRPIFIRLTSGPQPSIVTISQPAGGGFPTQTLLVAANSTQSLELTNWINNLECGPGDVIQNKGLKIVSNNKISAYYEVNANGPNPEVFSLKGSNALGSKFYISSQYLLNNTETHTPKPYSAFTIVATEDNTSINITPTNDIVGHAANFTFSVTLNAGQTYAAIAMSTLAEKHLQGSFVSSTKPIAITISDDLLKGTPFGGVCEDLAGDQTVPINIIGTEYIAFQTNLNNPFDKVYITATQNETKVTQDGALVATLNIGESKQLSFSTNTTYVQLSAPAYAYQLAGIGCEVGGAILPKLNCTGSNSVSVVRSSIENFIITLLVKNGSQGNFLLNNNSTIITSASFSVIPGTGGKWYGAKISLPLEAYPNGSVITITNSTSVFQMGFLEGGIFSGAGFGYFSDFNTLMANAVTPESVICIDNSIKLFADNIPSATYSWSGPNSFSSNVQNPTINNAIVLNSGNYFLSVAVPDCGSYFDTLSIIVKLKSFSTINEVICQGKSYFGYGTNGTYIDTFKNSYGCDSIRTLVLTVKPNAASIVNQIICNGKSFLGYNVTGTFIDTLIAANGCDSIRKLNLMVKTKSYSIINQTICEGQTFLGHNSNGTFTNIFTASNGCDSIQTLNLTVKPKADLIINQIICDGESFLGYNVSGTFIDTFTAANGCDSMRKLNLTVKTKSYSTINQIICEGQTFLGQSISGTFTNIFTASNGCDSIRTLVLTVKPNTASIINQIICNGESFLGYNVSGTFIDTLVTANGCDSIRKLNLVVKTKSYSTINQTICEGQTFLGHNSNGTFTNIFKASNGCDSILTLHLSVIPRLKSNISKKICNGQNYFGYTQTGYFIDSFIAVSGCDSIRTLSLEVQNDLTPTLINGARFCQGDSLIISPGLFDTYLWQDGSTSKNYVVKSEGNYSVTVSNSCSSKTISTFVLISDCQIYFPNSFTPDYNNRNDYFKILNATNLLDYYLVIFNRWGQKMFETKDYKVGWDGNYKGQPCNAGGYIWHCTYKKINVAKRLKGSLVLIR